MTLKLSTMVLATLVLIGCNVEAKSITFFAKQGEANECTLKKGDSCIVRLPGNPTTGYSWVAKTKNEDVVSVGEPEYQKNQNSRVVGSGGVYEFHVLPADGTAKGTAVVNFHYIRPWEANSLENAEPDYKLKCNVDD
eukprot:CAMPEP_0184486306 /NCGR_PEP_ID=MMETSP0113_2-20130426/7818_1 /TAXON_ID=91329 /ORGANISM="Norrisiella sphaerica, Strain BC52" /LENGTH=136 /DNA_ID=CAMNT_0026868119 /DNA_START=111 /DNA_END=521 /DNA_ORIENTATION=+